MGQPTETTPDTSAAILPLEAESGDAHGNKNHQQRRRRRRACVLASCCCLLLLFILVLVAVILFLTVFKPKDPTTTVVSLTVDGLATNLLLPLPRLDLNITLHLQIAVTNPNRASFDSAQGATDISYRDARVGSAVIEPARIPERGTGTVTARVTILTEAFLPQMLLLLQDAITGSFQLQADTTVPGRVKFLGFIKRHAVATVHCTVNVGIPDIGVRSQQCSQKTRL